MASNSTDLSTEDHFIHVESPNKPSVRYRSLTRFAAGSDVYGVALLGDLIYVVRDGGRQEVEVYDGSTLTFTIPISGLDSPTDVTASPSNDCIYVLNSSDFLRANFDKFFTTNIIEKTVVRLRSSNAKVFVVSHPRPSTPSSMTVCQWSVGDVALRQSLTPADTILVTCCVSLKLREFSSDGKQLRTIVLDRDLSLPLHAVQLADDEFLISQLADNGTTNNNRVCCVVVDNNGAQTVKLSRHVTSLHLAVGARACGASAAAAAAATTTTTTVLVFATYINSRQVQVLDSSLKPLVDLRSSVSRTPFSVCYDESRGRLYVALNRFNGQESDSSSDEEQSFTGAQQQQQQSSVSTPGSGFVEVFRVRVEHKKQDERQRNCVVS